MKLKLKWVADVIGEDYKQWEKGQGILIDSQTGTGKSHFVKNVLVKYADSILYVYNRTALGDQIKNELEQYSNVTCVSYQKVSEDLLDNEYELKNVDYMNYQFTILDEAHYVLQDSNFNNKTRVLLKWFYLRPNKNSITLYMSATCDKIMNLVQKKYSTNFKLYQTGNDYSYLKVKYFNKIDDTVELINKNEGKWLVFVNSFKMALKLLDDIYYSKFVCSLYSPYKKYMDKEELYNIVNNNKFETKCLIATKSLDNGINIKDDELTNIVIVTMDKIDFIQMLGRKRIDINNPQKVNLYIMQRNASSFVAKLNTSINPYNKMLELYNDNRTKFNREYNVNLDKVANNLFYMDGENWAMNLPYRTMLFLDEIYYNRMVSEFYNDENAFIKEQLNWLNLPFKKNNFIPAAINKNKLIDYLETMYETDTKLFKPEQNRMKQIICKDFDSMLKTLGCRKNSLGIKIINKLFDACKLDYFLYSKTEHSRKSKYRNKQFWRIVKKEES